MTTWTAQTQSKKYRPDSPKDMDREAFAARLAVCQSCPLRTAHTCRAANQLVSVLARRKSSRCPRALWSGDQPHPVPHPTIFPLDCKQADVVFFMGRNPAPGWWETKGRLSVSQLAEVGISAACVVNPDDSRLAEVFSRLKSKLVINRGFLISPEVIRRIAEKFPETKFLAMNHSSYPFLFTSHWSWKRHSEFLRMAESMPNCYIGTPDERNHLAKIRTDLSRKLRWIPNGSEIPAWSPRAIGDPPLVSLIAAGRPMKNLPNQLAGYALARRHREMRLLISIREQEAADLIRLACHDLRIDAEFSPWLDWEEYQQRIRQVDVGLQVSFTESFNYVGLEHLLVGAPVVGSMALRFLPREWQADPEDPEQIASHLLSRLEHWQADSRRARRLAVEFASQRNAQFVDAITSLLEEK